MRQRILVCTTFEHGFRRAHEPGPYDGSTPHIAVRHDVEGDQSAERKICRRPHQRPRTIREKQDDRPVQGSRVSTWLFKPWPHFSLHASYAVFSAFGSDITSQSGWLEASSAEASARLPAGLPPFLAQYGKLAGRRPQAKLGVPGKFNSYGPNSQVMDNMTNDVYDFDRMMVDWAWIQSPKCPSVWMQAE